MTIYLSENIKRLRLEKELTQETLAEFLGVTSQSVSNWERGESYPDITTLPSIASFFDISVDDLLGVSKVVNELKINKYIELYDTMVLKDLPATLSEYKKAAKEFPGDFRILVRYMNLLHEGKIRLLTVGEIVSGEYKKASEEISKIFDNIQKHCTDDSIRIWSKTIMINHLLWKYDCICNDEGKYGVYEEFLQQAKDISNTLPSMRDSKEISSFDRIDYYETHKNTLEELLYNIHIELFGFSLNCSAEDRIKQYECLQGLLELIYPDGIYHKNSFNRLYNIGRLGHLYHQVGNDEEALKCFNKAVMYAIELDKSPETTEKIKLDYNFGTAYREMSATQFIKTVIVEHYPLSDEFKSTDEFKKILSILEQ